MGFSLGGNVVLKLAGEMEESAREYVQGVCSVSAPLDLAACARRIGERENRLYEARFVRAMRKRLCATGRYQMGEFAGVRSVFELDDRFTAPSFGFGDAANYYRTQSAIGYLAGLRVPALLIQAKDDLRTVRDLPIGGVALQSLGPAHGHRVRRPPGIHRAQSQPPVVG